jgi:DNA-binding HxlR family transcriptional regulator
MAVLARPWTGLVLATLAGEAPLRFSELRERLSVVGDRMLSLRLKELEGHGLVARTVAPGPPVRVEYALTETGRGFEQVVNAIAHWGERLNPTAASRDSAPASRRKGTSRAR